MRKLSLWATRLALIATATGGVVAACYDDVPGPSAPLPPTREVRPFGSKPKPLRIPIVSRKQPTAVVQYKPEFDPATPAHDVRDAGVLDVVDLPPVGDASGLDAPIDKK